MTDATDIFSDTLTLFVDEDAPLEPPTEVRYGPVQSKIVSRAPRSRPVLWCLSSFSHSSLITRERLSKFSPHRSSTAASCVTVLRFQAGADGFPTQVMAEMVELRRVNPSGKRRKHIGRRGTNAPLTWHQSQFLNSVHRRPSRHYSHPRLIHLRNLS